MRSFIFTLYNPGYRPSHTHHLQPPNIKQLNSPSVFKQYQLLKRSTNCQSIHSRQVQSVRLSQHSLAIFENTPAVNISNQPYSADECQYLSRSLSVGLVCFHSDEELRESLSISNGFAVHYLATIAYVFEYE